MIKYLIAFLCLMNSMMSYAYWSCAWPYRTELNIQEESGATLTDYQIEVSLRGRDLNGAYSWTDNGFDLRIIDSDDETLLDFWVEDWDQSSETATVWIRLDSLSANANKTLYIYYGNEFAEPLANVPFTFVEPGIKFHTRRVTQDPNSLAQAQSRFDGADDNRVGYGCKFISNFVGIENSIEFGSNVDFIAYSETYFNVENDETGLWNIRYGADFGGGGGLYVDGIALEEQWNDDLWWDFNWNDAQEVLEGSINLSSGYHKLEVIGQEGGNDGGITVQFQRPGGAFTSYSTSEIDIVSRACPVSSEPTYSFGAQATAICPAPIAEYRLDEGGWSGSGDVIDQSGNFPGTMVGNVTAVDNTQVCRGAQVGSNTSKSEIDIIQTGVDLDRDVGAVGAIGFWVRFDQDWDALGGLTVLDATLAVTGNASDKYFVLTKESNGRLRWRFEDSADADFNYIEAAPSSSRTADTWYHITLNFDFPGDEFSLYVNEDRVIYQTPNTTGAVRDFDYIAFGDNNAPLSSAGGSSSNATFDEINIFNATLSISEISGLMAKARNCPTVVAKSCSEVFPDGLVALDDGSIEFGFDAQLINNPDNQLSASIIRMNGAPNQFTCGGSNVCTTGDPTVSSISAGPFQYTLSTTDVNIPFRGSQTVGITTNQYRTINTNFRSELSFSNSTYNEFFINTLNIGGRNTVNLAPGTYWINNLSVGNTTVFNVTGSGPVRLYINNVNSLNSNIIMNSPGDGVAGNPENLLLYFYDTNVSFGNTTTISGTVYAAGDVVFASDGFIFGLFAAQNINLASNSQVTYMETAYDGLSDISWCASASPTIANIVISAASTGVNCLPSEIDVSIFDSNGDLFTDYNETLNLSTDVLHGDWTLGLNALGTINNGASDDGVATYSMVTADGGTVTLDLNNTHAEVTQVTVEAEGVSQTETIDFQPAGFVFSNIPNQVAALNSNVLTLQAVETDQVTGSCQSILLDPATVELAVECISPNDCQAATVQINGNLIADNLQGASPISYQSVNLNFGDENSNLAPIVFNYNDAGALRLYASYELKDASGANTGNTLYGASNDFVVLPAGFCIESQDVNWQCSTPALNGGCSAFKEAGATFDLTVTAKQSNGVSTDFCTHLTTNNFNGDVNLSHTLVSPSVGSGGEVGVFSLSGVSLTSGVASVPASFTEMGVFTVTAGGNAYQGVVLPSNASDNIGRFYPSQFNIISSINAAYDDGHTGFTYTGQLESDGMTGSISYLTEPSFVFEVVGANDQTLHNYMAPLYSTPVATVSASSATLGNLSAPLSVTASISNGSITGPDASDQFTYTFNNSDHFRFDRDQNSLRAPFPNDIELTISSFREPVDLVDIATSYTLTGSGGLIYYGRVKVENAYGPETEPVPQVFKTEFYDGSQFVLNSLDSDSAYDLSNVFAITVTDVGNSGNSLTVGDSSISGASGNVGFFASGLLQVNWSVPVNGRYGAYRFSYGVESWLKYDWDGSGDGVNEDPNGNVSFGQYRGNDRIIYWKEINY